MSDINSIILKILNNYEEKVGNIIKKANEEASEIMKKHIGIAEKEKEQIMNDAELEAKKAAEQIIEGKKLEIRDHDVAAKWEAIHNVFAIALQQLNAMPKDEYLKFLCNHLQEMDLIDASIILPSRYGFTDIEEIRDLLKEDKEASSLKLHEGNRDVDGGFILVKDGVEHNYTFATLLQYRRYELESEITQSLFAR